MEFLFGGDFVDQLVSKAKKDPELALALAHEVMGMVDPQKLEAYLMAGDVPADLLTSRLMADPAATLAELHALAERLNPPRKKPRKKPKKVARAKKAPAKKPARRKRLTREEAEKKKAAIVAFLKKNPWSGRRQIAEVAEVETQAVYARLMSELRETGQVVSRGQKAKTRYAAGEKGKKGKKGKGKAKGKGKGKAKGKGKGKGKGK